MTGFLLPRFRVRSFFQDDPADYSGYTHAAKPDWIKIMGSALALWAVNHLPVVNA